MSPSPPAPTRWNVVSTINSLVRDPMGYMSELREHYGPIVELPLLRSRGYILSSPELVEEVLVKNASHYGKDLLLKEITPLLGRGLLTSDGEHWKAQRRLVSPPLARRQIESYATTMVDLTEAFVASLGDGEHDIHHAMMTLTLDVVVATLFGTGLTVDAHRVGHCLEVVMDHFQHVKRGWGRLLPDWLPLPRNRAARVATEELNNVVFDVIAQRQRQGAAGDDLLSRLIRATDDDGVAMDRMQLRDEAITIFLAGHETTAITLTNTLWLLAEHTLWLDGAREEIDALARGRALSLDDAASLHQTEAIIKESLRLFPPAWAMAREALQDTEIGGYPVRKGSQVYMSQFVMHRDPKYFPTPERFAPERWLEPANTPLPRFAYFPFGGGPRICIGNHFAMLEAKLLLATLLRHLDFKRRPGHRIEYGPSVTHRPINGAPMTVSRRHGS